MVSMLIKRDWLTDCLNGHLKLWFAALFFWRLHCTKLYQRLYRFLCLDALDQWNLNAELTFLHCGFMHNWNKSPSKPAREKKISLLKIYWCHFRQSMIDDGKCKQMNLISCSSYEFDAIATVCAVMMRWLLVLANQKWDAKNLLNSIIKMAKLSTLKFFMAANGNFC